MVLGKFCVVVLLESHLYAPAGLDSAENTQFDSGDFLWTMRRTGKIGQLGFTIFLQFHVTHI